MGKLNRRTLRIDIDGLHVKHGTVARLAEDLGFREDMLEVMKTLEVISKDTWSTPTTSSTVPGTPGAR